MKEKDNIKGFWGCKGFTLIELLVVVLIIAILAAVAMPQYQKVVRKAQTREVLVAIDALSKAYASYTLNPPEHSWAKSMTAEDLDIAIPTLKYFKYTTFGSSGRTPTYDFQGGSFWGGSSDGQNVSFTKDGLKLDIYWGNGKLISKHCESTSKTQPCSDFSPSCGMGTETLHDTGSGTYTSYLEECDF